MGGSGKPYSYAVAALNLFADHGMKQAFMAGSATLYAFGQIEYEDIFDHRLTYSWAYQFEPEVGFVHLNIYTGILDSPPGWDEGMQRDEV